MTLKEFCTRHKIHPCPPTTETGAVTLIVPVEHPDHWQLWHLSDYHVSTRSGPVVWLVPTDRTTPAPVGR
jgi:hypothetical protein